MATAGTPQQLRGLLREAESQLAKESNARSHAEQQLAAHLKEVEQHKSKIEEQIDVIKEEADERWRKETSEKIQLLTDNQRLQKLIIDAEEEHKLLQAKHQQSLDDYNKLKDDMNKVNNLVNEQRRKADTAARKAQEALVPVTAERDDLKREVETLAKASAALQEQLKEAKSASSQPVAVPNPTPFFATQNQAARASDNPFNAMAGPATSIPGATVHASNQPQAAMDISTSIHNGLRASSSATQASTQELKYSQADFNRRVIAAKQAQFEEDKLEAQQHVESLKA